MWFGFCVEKNLSRSSTAYITVKNDFNLHHKNTQERLVYSFCFIHSIWSVIVHGMMWLSMVMLFIFSVSVYLVRIVLLLPFRSIYIFDFSNPKSISFLCRFRITTTTLFLVISQLFLSIFFDLAEPKQYRHQ